MPLASSHRPPAGSHDASGTRRDSPCTVPVSLAGCDFLLVAQPQQQGAEHVPAGLRPQVLSRGLVTAGGEKAAHVLDEHQRRAQLADCRGHVMPDAGPGAVAQPRPRAGLRDVLAWRPAAQDVDGLDLRPVHRRYVPEVRDAGEAVRENPRRAGVDVGDPRQLAAEQVPDRQVEAAVSSLSKPTRCVAQTSQPPPRAGDVSRPSRPSRCETWLSRRSRVLRCDDDGRDVPATASGAEQPAVIDGLLALPAVRMGAEPGMPQAAGRVKERAVPDAAPGRAEAGHGSPAGAWAGQPEVTYQPSGGHGGNFPWQLSRLAQIHPRAIAASLPGLAGQSGAVTGHPPGAA